MDIRRVEHQSIPLTRTPAPRDVKKDSPEIKDRVDLQESSKPQGQSIRIDILHMNDVHGQVTPLIQGAGDQQKEVGGLAGAKTVIEAQRQENPGGTLTLNAGDIAEGTMEAYLTKGKIVTSAMGEIGFDAVTLGNHDFAWGRDNLDEMIKDARAPFIAANVRNVSDGSLMKGLKPYIMRDLKGVKVAVIGLETPETGFRVDRKLTRGLQFDEGARTVSRYLPEVREKGADLVVVLSHLGFEQDRELARQVEGIDIIVGGHSHTELEEGHREGDTVIVQAGSQGRFVGKLSVEVNPENKKIISTVASLLPVEKGIVEPDPGVMKILQPYMEEVERIGSRLVGHAREDLPHSHKEPAKLNQIYADAVRNAVPEADFALTSSRKLRGNLKKGDVTFKDIYSVVPFADEKVVVIKARGETLKNEMELRVKEGGRGLQIGSGLSYEYDTTLPDMNRITKIQLHDGSSLDPQREYVVAIDESTITKPHFEGVEVLKTVGGCQDIMVDYFQNNGPWQNDPDQRVIKRP